MSAIKNIFARQILDSRGFPTVEVDLWTSNDYCGRAAVPSGASTGKREALELRDGNPARFLGKGVQRAIDNVNQKLHPLLLGRNVFHQKELDSLMLELDGTEFKSQIGANAILAVSIAICKAAALEQNKPLWQYLFEDLKVPNPIGKPLLPTPLMNIINGGKHAHNNLDIQEFMIVPCLDRNFAENLRAGAEIFQQLKKVLAEAKHSTNVGDEGGFAPNFESHQDALDCIIEAIEKAGYRPNQEIKLAIDSASSEFYHQNQYTMQGRAYSGKEMIQYYSDLCTQYPIYSIEDGLAENDFANWTQLTAQLGNKVLIVGDDLFVTNKKILQEGIRERQANAILIKVNQIGSLTETFETLELAFQNNFKAIISHRSGETGDTFIADLAVATGAGHIKTGATGRSERVEKYNQLLRIEEMLGDKANCAGMI